MSMKRCHGFYVTLTMILVSVIFPSSTIYGEGLTYQAVQIDTPQTLTLTQGMSRILETSESFKRASMANPKIADQIVLSPKQIYLTGLAVGTTTLTMWDKAGKVSSVFQVQVSPDVGRLKQQLHDLLPQEADLKVLNSHDHITLAGNVSNAEAMTTALALAEPYAPEKVLNLLQVGGVQQVMMEVKIAEMQRGLLKRLGVNFNRQQLGHRDFSIGTLSDLTSFEPDGDTGLFNTIVGSLSNVALGFNIGTDAWSVALAMLKEHGLSRALAEPTLITESGQAAQFLVGGEFPVPVPSGLAQTSIQFKEFGIRLQFTPTVLSNEKISVVIAPEVSELDFGNGLVSNGFQIPSLKSRKVNTVVELGDGQSFAIAGLLQDNIEETISKYPFLGEIPVLGALFRSTSFRKSETELIVIVTPHLVKPLDMAKQTLPTDYYLEPNDFELFFLGNLEGKYSDGASIRPSTAYPASQAQISPRLARKRGSLDGRFGHLAP